MSCITISATKAQCITISATKAQCISICTTRGSYNCDGTQQEDDDDIIVGYFTTMYFDNSGSMSIVTSEELDNGNTLLTVSAYDGISVNTYNYFEVTPDLDIIYSQGDMCGWLETIERVEESMVFYDSGDTDNNCTPRDSFDTSIVDDNHYLVSSSGVTLIGENVGVPRGGGLS